MQAGGGVEPDPAPEAGAQYFARLVRIEAQVGDADVRQLAAGHQVGELQIERPARSHEELQVGRRVVQQVGEHRAEGDLRHAVRVVEHHDRRRGERRDLREQQGQRVELAVLLQAALHRGQRECVPARRIAEREAEQVHELRPLVLGVERGPGDEGAALEPAAAPLGQQRRLAETLGSGHDDRGTVVDLGPALLEARPGRERPAEFRGRGLEQEP